MVMVAIGNSSIEALNPHHPVCTKESKFNTHKNDFLIQAVQMHA